MENNMLWENFLNVLKVKFPLFPLIPGLKILNF